MNGPTRSRFYRMIADRDGEFCRGCGALPWEKQLVLDHKDNNNGNNDPANLQFLCRSCNYLKNPRKPVDECVSVSEGEYETSELSVNRLKEPMFKKYVATRINESGKVPETDLINAGAEHLDISPVTTKRYLNKLCSSAGIYERSRIGGTIIVRYKKDLSQT
jgi:hypothetical protein